MLPRCGYQKRKASARSDITPLAVENERHSNETPLYTNLSQLMYRLNKDHKTDQCKPGARKITSGSSTQHGNLPSFRLLFQEQGCSHRLRGPRDATKKDRRWNRCRFIKRSTSRVPKEGTQDSVLPQGPERFNVIMQILTICSGTIPISSLGRAGDSSSRIYHPTKSYLWESLGEATKRSGSDNEMIIFSFAAADRYRRVCDFGTLNEWEMEWDEEQAQQGLPEGPSKV